MDWVISVDVISSSKINQIELSIWLVVVVLWSVGGKEELDWCNTCFIDSFEFLYSICISFIDRNRTRSYQSTPFFSHWTHTTNNTFTFRIIWTPSHYTIIDKICDVNVFIHINDNWKWTIQLWEILTRYICSQLNQNYHLSSIFEFHGNTNTLWLS